MGVVGEFFVYLLKIPVGIFKEMFIEVFGADFEQNIHPFLFRGEFQGEVELFLRLVDIILSFLLADVLAACHYREKLSGIDTCFRIVPVLLQHLVQIHISLFRMPQGYMTEGCDAIYIG